MGDRYNAVTQCNGIADFFIGKVDIEFEPIIIVFAKGYNEPEESVTNGKKKQKNPNGWLS